MKTTSCVKEALRDAKVIEALSVARFALGSHDRLPFIREGERIEMDFRYEIRKIDEALEMLGVDTTELISPQAQDTDSSSKRRRRRATQTVGSGQRTR